MNVQARFSATEKGPSFFTKKVPGFLKRSDQRKCSKLEYDCTTMFSNILLLIQCVQYLLDPRPWPEGSYELGCLSFCPSALPSGTFLGIGSLVFSETRHGVRGPCGDALDRARFFGGENCPKNGENGLKMDLLENLVINFFWIWSIKKVYINCYFLAQIPYLRKIWFLIYGPKCFWLIISQNF